jgi:predicted CopG family antitoxin
MPKKWIRIEEDTHKRLVELGGKAETFDEIIRRYLPKE